MSIESENATLRAQIAELRQQVGARMDLPPQERDEIAKAQVRADAVAQQFGDVGASPPIPGETGTQYRRRVLGHFAKYSPTYKSADIQRISDPALLAAAEETVYSDAAKAAVDPASYKPGELRAIKSRDITGRQITSWVGDNMAWMQMFMTPGRVGRFVDPPPRKR